MRTDCTFARLLGALLAGLPIAVAAESIAGSAASMASMTASSASDSLGASSNSSRGGKTARAGEYRIEAVAAAAQPGKAQLTLAPLEPTPERGTFVLALPQTTFDEQRLARGDTVAVRERPYGFEFARGDTRQAFFLVLDDDWQRELAPRPVGAAPRAL